MSYTLRADSQNDPKPYYVAAALVFVAIVIFGTLTIKQFDKIDYAATPKVTIDKDVPKPLPTNLISAESVKDLAVTKAPKSSVDKVNLQKSNNQLVYVVNLDNGEQLTFDAQTGDQLPDDKSSNAVLPINPLPTTPNNQENSTTTIPPATPGDDPQSEPSSTADKPSPAASKETPGYTTLPN